MTTSYNKDIWSSFKAKNLVSFDVRVCYYFGFFQQDYKNLDIQMIIILISKQML